MPPARGTTVKKEDVANKKKVTEDPTATMNTEQLSYFALPIEQWQAEILKLKSYNVIKWRKIFQSLFYLLGYCREDVCERDTNRLDWKKAKGFINNQFLHELVSYEPTGPKE